LPEDATPPSTAAGGLEPGSAFLAEAFAEARRTSQADPATDPFGYLRGVRGAFARRGWTIASGASSETAGLRECAICGDYTSQGVEVHEVCLDVPCAACRVPRRYHDMPEAGRDHPFAVACSADEYEALAQQLHDSIAEGQSVEDTAKALQLLASGASSETAGLDVERLARALQEEWRTKGWTQADMRAGYRPNAERILARLTPVAGSAAYYHNPDTGRGVATGGNIPPLSEPE
jgi:hypothetical protein